MAWQLICKSSIPVKHLKIRGKLSIPEGINQAMVSPHVFINPWDPGSVLIFLSLTHGHYLINSPRWIICTVCRNYKKSCNGLQCCSLVASTHCNICMHLRVNVRRHSSGSPHKTDASMH